MWCSSHAKRWYAFADSSKHAMTVNEKLQLDMGESGLAVIVYLYDRLTTDLYGFQARDWQRKCEQVTTHFSLSSTLPIDVIKVSKS